MTGSIETITDQERLSEIFNTVVISSDVYMRTSSGSLKIKFLGYNSGQIAFRVPFIKTMPDSALVFARHKETTIYAEMRTVEKQEDDVFIFSPIKVQLFHSGRQESRASVSSDSQKNLLYVSNFISDFLLFDCIKREKRRIEVLRDKLLTDMKKIFTEVKIHLNSEEGVDARMRYFYEFANSPVYIVNVNQPPAPGSESKAAFYREQMYLKEQFNMKRKGLISEISVPILFRGFIPVGYIQINNTVPINESYMQILRRAADLAAQAMDKMKIFTEICPDKLLVADLSKSGLGIVFRDRKYIRFFKEKSITSFDLQLGNGKVIAIAVIVRNISLMENKVVKLGCALRGMDPEAAKVYEEYVSSVVKDAPAPAPVPPKTPAAPTPMPEAPAAEEKNTEPELADFLGEEVPETPVK
jgi:hypothetical protein